MAEGQRQERQQGTRTQWQGRKQCLLDHVEKWCILKHAWCRKGSNKNLYAIDEEDSEHVEEENDSEKDLQAWCLLEESENDQ